MEEIIDLGNLSDLDNGFSNKSSRGGGGGSSGGGGGNDSNDSPPVAAVYNVVGGYLTQVYVNAFGRQPDAGGLAYWSGKFAEQGIDAAVLGNMTINATSPSGALSGVLTGVNANAALVLRATADIISAGVTTNETNANGLLGKLTTESNFLTSTQAVINISATIVNSVANGASAGAITARAIVK